MADDDATSSPFVGFDFRHVRGDLFEGAPPNDSLAHCVSKDLRMGMGIAKQFRDRFNRIQKLIGQKKDVGEVAYLPYEVNSDQIANLREQLNAEEDPGPSSSKLDNEYSNRYVFYMITKKYAKDKPTKDDFKRTLYSLRHLCERLNVTGLSMPRIGMGLDNLRMDFVMECMCEVFRDSKMNISMFYI